VAAACLLLILAALVFLPQETVPDYFKSRCPSAALPRLDCFGNLSSAPLRTFPVVRISSMSDP
jgi:hypothetical protein